MRALRALTRAASRDLFLHKMASPALLIERHAPGVRLFCPKKCEEQDAAKIFNLKCPEHDFRAHFCRNRLILAKNGVCRPTGQTDCSSSKLILTKKAREKRCCKNF